MRSFEDLVQKVQNKNLCHRCGGCVTFCTAINYGALELKNDGHPGYRDKEKCIECGICYMLCPEMRELDEEIKKLVGWSEPAGRIMSTSIVRAKDEQVLQQATDGGAVTSILLHLLESGLIDGAIVSKHVGLFNREPNLAATREDIVNSCGSFFDASHGMVLYSEHYSTYSPSIQALSAVKKNGARRVAFVGTPCQIATVRKMQAMGVVPSDSIYCLLGLFCSGNFAFDDNSRKRLEKIGDFRWSDVKKINIKGKMYVYLNNGVIHTLPLDELDFIKRHACRYCDDYAAEYADLSFGGIGAEEGWTTVLTRTPLGMKILNSAERSVLDKYSHEARGQDQAEEQTRNRIRELRQQVRHHAYAQQGVDDPAMTDPEYDTLVQELRELESKYPGVDSQAEHVEFTAYTRNALNKLLEKSADKKRAAQEHRAELG
jgi:coenzyme F420 hydrogenase subunit beta